MSCDCACADSSVYRSVRKKLYSISVMLWLSDSFSYLSVFSFIYSFCFFESLSLTEQLKLKQQGMYVRF
jgi:hypothetical protein